MSVCSRTQASSCWLPCSRVLLRLHLSHTCRAPAIDHLWWQHSTHKSSRHFALQTSSSIAMAESDTPKLPPAAPVDDALAKQMLEFINASWSPFHAVGMCVCVPYNKVPPVAALYIISLVGLYAKNALCPVRTVPH